MSKLQTKKRYLFDRYKWYPLPDMIRRRKEISKNKIIRPFSKRFWCFFSLYQCTFRIEMVWLRYGSVRKPVAFLSDYAHNLDNLNRKNGISETPLNWLLNAFTLALKIAYDSVECNRLFYSINTQKMRVDILCVKYSNSTPVESISDSNHSYSDLNLSFSYSSFSIE